MVDPTNITNYNLTVPELEERILFWVCAAGKNGVTAAKCLDKCLSYLKSKHPDCSSPFALIRALVSTSGILRLASIMRGSGIGCYHSKANSFSHLAFSNIDLKCCGIVELEAIHGIGPKTARCFLIHSRPNQRFAGLDRHITRWLYDNKLINSPTPPSKKHYPVVEQIFISEAERLGKNIAELDIEIWNQYRNKK